jgi:CRP/FNR family cyclic AMP-dependent transcriptional regulator
MTTNTSGLWYFESVNLYQVLCPHKVAVAKDSHTLLHFKKNDFIYFTNEEATTIYMISSGRVRIGYYLEDGKEVVKSVLTAGEIFGEMALAGLKNRNDFAQAMDDETVICSLNIDELKGLMYRDQELSFKLLKLIGLRITRLERKLELLVFKDVRTRIIEFLVDVAKTRGKKIGFEVMIPIRFTHKDIAGLTGTSRQTVTTVLNELRDKNLINFDRRKILIRDLEQLTVTI